VIRREQFDRARRRAHRFQQTLESLFAIPPPPEVSIRKQDVHAANKEWLRDTNYRLRICDPPWRVTVERIIREHARRTLPVEQFARKNARSAQWEERLYEIAGVVQVEPKVAPVWQSELFVETPGRATVYLDTLTRPFALYHTHPVGFDTPSEADCDSFVRIAQRNGLDAVRFGILSTQFDTVGWYKVVKRGEHN
jgi:proteasome lid subunit RPN8/RPN11